MEKGREKAEKDEKHNEIKRNKWHIRKRRKGMKDEEQEDERAVEVHPGVSF